MPVNEGSFEDLAIIRHLRKKEEADAGHYGFLYALLERDGAEEWLQQEALARLKFHAHTYDILCKAEEKARAALKLSINRE